MEHFCDGLCVVSLFVFVDENLNTGIEVPWLSFGVSYLQTQIHCVCSRQTLEAKISGCCGTSCSRDRGRRIWWPLNHEVHMLMVVFSVRRQPG